MLITSKLRDSLSLFGKILFAQRWHIARLEWSMRRFFQVGSLALFAATSALITGCTTEQRSGRTTGEYIDDKSLNTKVRSALSDSTEYKFPDVKVESFRGTVQLSGFVPSAQQKARATEIVKSIRGVQTVDNKISVR